MSDIQLLRTHHLAPNEARAIVDRLASDLEARFGLKANWNGNTLHLERSGVDGQVRLEDGQVRVEVRLGLLMRAFKSTVEEEIRRKLEQLFPSAA